ncbi:MAG: RagB/SusD family nutrient uptake outer membrane protein [Bacteroidaceae bacterium]|nr:RagB/SusD family nutrient uptake outer membrane protein [Bacteroidaceae bacterium]
MKNYIKLFLATGILGLTTGCTDLDVDTVANYDYNPNPDLSGVYTHLRGTMGRRYMEAQALSSDEWVGISFEGGYYDSGTYAHASLHNYSPDDASIGWYDDITAGITKANNKIIEFGDDKANSGAARAMRAYFHWILIDSYGDAPILDQIFDDSVKIQRHPRAEVAQFIADELEEVIPYLSEEVTEETYGTATKWMAEALLIKLYINWPVYTASDVTAYDAANYKNEKLNRVVELCDDIIKSGKFDLTDSYRSKFYPNNGYHIKDFIYAIPYDTYTATGMQYGRPRSWRQANTGTSYYGMTLSKSCGGNFSMTPEMSDLFSLDGDDRNGVIIGGQVYMHDPLTYEKTSTPFTYNGEPVVLTKDITLKDENEELNTGADVNGWSQGYKSIKWYITDDDYKNNRNQSNDLPIFRYADVILTKCEAILRGANATNGDTPQSLFNQIRKYVNAPEITANPTLEELLDERGREFFDENWRRNDMIRFGTFESEYGFHKKGFPTARFDKTCRVFPIPTTTLNNNPGFKQNEGY